MIWRTLLLLLGASVAFAEQPKVDLKDYVFYVYLKPNEIVKVDRFVKGGGEKELWAITPLGELKKFAIANVLAVKPAKREPIPQESNASKESISKTILDLTTDQFANVDKEITISNAVLTLSTYFNYGYRNNGLTHLSFEIRDKTGRGHVYVSKDWAGAEAFRQMALKDGQIAGDFIVAITSAHYDSDAPGLMAELMGFRPAKE